MPLSKTLVEAAKARRATRIAEGTAEVLAERAPSAARRAFPNTTQAARNVVAPRQPRIAMNREFPRFGAGEGGAKLNRSRINVNVSNSPRQRAAREAREAAETVTSPKDRANKIFGASGSRRRNILYAGGGVMGASMGMNAVLGPKPPPPLSNTGYQSYTGSSGGMY